MKITNLRTIHFTRKELKLAIGDFLTHRIGRTDLACYVDENECEMLWAQKTGPEDPGFLVSINREFEE